jgi:hypothetical protein
MPFQDSLFRYVLDKQEDSLNTAVLFKDPLLHKRLISRIGSIMVITGGIISTGYFAYKWRDAAADFKAISPETFDVTVLNRDNGTELWNQTKSKYHKYVIYTSGCLLLTAGGVFGLKWSFSF